MKINKFFKDRNAKIRIKIEDPEDPKNPAYFIGYSAISDKGIEFDNARQRKVQSRMVTGKNKNELDLSKALEDPAENYLNKVEKCCHLIVDWQGVKDDEGNDLPFSTDKLREILERREMEFLTELLLDKLEHDEGNLQGSREPI